MINEARKFLNADKVTKYRLMDEYNKLCAPHVAADRKYRIQYNDNWCAMFTTVMANRKGLKPSEFPFEVSVFYQVQWAKKNNKFVTDVAKVKPNDLIIYSWKQNGVYDHVGIVVEVSNGTIKVIEGNIRDTVGYRTVPQNSKSVVGFIQTSHSPKPLNADQERERIANLAQKTVRGDFGNGVARMQTLGGDYEAVQSYINNFY